MAELDEIKDQREYTIRYGKMLERFTEEFWKKYKHDPFFNHVQELLIRGADPYTVIEILIEINAKTRDAAIKVIEHHGQPLKFDK